MLKLHVLHALEEAIAIVTNNSITLFVVHHSEIVGLLGHDGAVFAKLGGILDLDGQLLLRMSLMLVEVHKTEGSASEFCLEKILLVVVLD